MKMMKMVKKMSKKNAFTIGFRVSAKEYEIWHSLSEKEKRNLTKLMRLLIIAMEDSDFADLVKISTEISFSEETLQRMREIVKETDYKEIAKKLLGILKTIKNMMEYNKELKCEDALSQFQSVIEFYEKFLNL